MTRHDGGPAFPTKNPNEESYSGLTVRDWFAGQIAAGIYSRTDTGATLEHADTLHRLVSEQAYQAADALLARKISDE